ncbi:cell adhesion molecule CEACAM1 isoform 2-T2 [Rhynchonycteris naso]
MESPSAPTSRGRGPWQRVLLAVSLLTFWSPPTTAKLTVESVPSNAAEGKDVLLLVRNQTENFAGYSWYKGEGVDSNHLIASYAVVNAESTPGPAYSVRETIYPNGSLLLQNVTLKDTGYYTLNAIKKNFQNEEGIGQLHVYAVLPTPSITSNHSSPEEHKDPVVLTCESHTQDATYLWLINSQSLLDSTRLELSKDNRTLTLLHVTRNDTGPYECETRNPVSVSRSDPFYLNVLYGPDTPTISPSYSYYLPGANLSLSCHAASNPPPQYSWFINGRPQLSTQELFIPNLTANDSGSYTCFAHNSATRLNRTTVKNITISEPVGKPSIQARNDTVTEHKDTVVLACLTNDTGISIGWIFNNQSLRLTERMKLSQGNSTLTIDPVRREDAGDYQCEVSNPVSSSKSDPFRLDDPTPPSSSLSDGAIAGIVIGVLAGAALIAALVYFLYIRKTGGASDQRDLTEHKPSASNHSQGHSDNAANEINEVIYSSLNFKAQESKIPTSASPSSTATETVYLEVKIK